jgi:hypothetical protein
MPPNERPEPALPPQNATQPPAPLPIPSSPSPTVQEEPPDPWKWFQRCIYRRFGLRGWLIVVLLIVIVPWLWSNWGAVKGLPIVFTSVTWFFPLPKADPQRFAVALAHLEHDKDQQYARLIREVLKDFEGVQLLQFDRTISLGVQSQRKARRKAMPRRDSILKTQEHMC